LIIKKRGRPKSKHAPKCIKLESAVINDRTVESMYRVVNSNYVRVTSKFSDKHTFTDLLLPAALEYTKLNFSHNCTFDVLSDKG